VNNYYIINKSTNMTRDSIVERLLDQGHITIRWADIILNKKERCIERITELHTDGNINTNEAVLLINENVIVPNVIMPDFIQAPAMPYIPMHDGTGNPPNIWCTTTSHGKGHAETDNQITNEKK
jgi:hypothetical protein